MFDGDVEWRELTGGQHWKARMIARRVIRAADLRFAATVVEFNQRLIEHFRHVLLIALLTPRKMRHAGACAIIVHDVPLQGGEK